MATQPQWLNYWRVRREAAFNSAIVNSPDWNVSTDSLGWHNLPPMDSDGLNAEQAVIFPSGQSGQRSLYNAIPVAGAYETALGTLEMPVYPELIDPFLYNIFGQVTRTETAGTAALASTAFASVATLDTQPNGTEMLKFTISSSAAASSAVINVIQDSATVESITIPDSGSSVDGDYYTKGGYDGSTNAITFTVSGSVTGGNVVIAGVDYVTNVFTPVTTNTVPTLQIEQGGRPEAGSGNSEFFNGVVVSTSTLSYDRLVTDGLLAWSGNLMGRFPGSGATAGTYNDDASDYYRPIAGWTGTVSIGGDSGECDRIVSATININPNNDLLPASCGTRQPSEAISGQMEVTGSLVIRPEDETYWNAFVNNTVQDLELDFVTPFYVVDTTGYQFKIDISSAYIDQYTRSRQGQAQTATLNFRAIYNDGDSGAVRITTRCRMPV